MASLASANAAGAGVERCLVLFDLLRWGAVLLTASTRAEELNEAEAPPHPTDEPDAAPPTAADLEAQLVHAF